MRWIRRCARIERALTALIALGALASCAESPSVRCKQLCEREAECVERLADERTRFDKTECAMECSALERDRAGKPSVDRHMACAEQAATCDALLECR